MVIKKIHTVFELIFVVFVFVYMVGVLVYFHGHFFSLFQFFKKSSKSIEGWVPENQNRKFHKTVNFLHSKSFS